MIASQHEPYGMWLPPRTAATPAAPGGNAPAQQNGGAAAPAPQDQVHFQQSSTDLKQDVLCGMALVGTRLLPSPVGTGIGCVFGPAFVLAGWGELREGVRTRNTKEAFNGVMHMVLGGVMAASAVSSSAIGGPWLMWTGLTLLAVKTIINHPRETAELAGKESVNLFKNAGKTVALEFGEWRKQRNGVPNANAPAVAPPPQPPAPPPLQPEPDEH